MISDLGFLIWDLGFLTIQRPGIDWICLLTGQPVN